MPLIKWLAGMLKTRHKSARYPLAGVLVQGAPIEPSKFKVDLPKEEVDRHEIVFRFEGESPPDLGVVDGDLLIADPRRGQRTSTGQLVIATLNDRAFIGTWWAKNGQRELRDGSLATIAKHPRLRVLAVVTLIIRVISTTPRPH